VIIAERYRDLVNSYLETSSPWRGGVEAGTVPKLYGLPVQFSPPPEQEPQWEVINFSLEREPGVPIRYPYFRLFE
jgi:hypothetical protein